MTLEQIFLAIKAVDDRTRRIEQNQISEISRLLRRLSDAEDRISRLERPRKVAAGE